jgi:hypothetical protein
MRPQARTWSITRDVHKRRSAVTTPTYLGSGDASRHRRDYRPDWLDSLADDVTMEGSVLTGIAEGPNAILNHRPLRSVLLWSQLMGEHFAGTRHAQYFLSHDAAEALHEATETR